VAGLSLPRPRGDRDAVLAGAAVSGFALLLVACGVKFGLAGLVLPLLAVLGVVLLRFPGLTLSLAVTVTILAEDSDFPLFSQGAKLYTNLLKGFTPLDAILAVAVVGVILRIVAEGRPVLLPPRPLALTLLLIVAGLVCGLIAAHANGAGTTEPLLATHTFVYLVLVPLLVVNLDVTERDVTRLLALGLALAAVKAVIGFGALAKGGSATIDGETALTYYAPTANWLMTLALLGVVAALVLRAKQPWWIVAVAPLVLLCLVLSYRRSFWIADAIGLLLVVTLGVSSSASGRRLIVPVVAALGIGIYLLGNVALQSDTPLAERVQSLSPSKVSATPDDRYRLDERANVLHAIGQQPIAGLGLEVPWRATQRSLPVEVNPDHLYVHFAALFWWLKLGLLGLLAYAGILVSAAWLSIRAWTGRHRPAVRAFGLASLCSVFGLVAIETTATFTGSDPRFTLLLAAQLGLLAAIDRLPARDDQAEAAS
jgi:O-antigen ligase